MYKNNKNGKILNVLLGIIALFIIIFIIAWIVQKGNSSSNYDKIFTNNLNNMQSAAKEYFANDLPKEYGTATTLSLKDMYELNLTDTLSYGNTNCDENNSYISITKTGDNEYRVKSTLVCGNKEDNIVEKITNNTIIEDENGNIINNDATDDIILDIDNETITSSDGKTPDTVKCTGPICKFVYIETDCTTTYEYEYIKRNISCPDGYILSNGTCQKTISETTDPIANYTESSETVADAIKNPGTSYKKYTNVITSGGNTTKYCQNGTLNSDGYCYEYTNKTTSSSTTCPTGYTKNGNYCYKYADLVTSSSSTCPSGYEKKNGACYTYTNLVTSSSSSCPAGYENKNGACYTYANLETSSSTTYDCPTYYTKSGSGANTKCYKTVAAVKSYTAWGNPTSSYQTKTQESTYTYELTKKVLVGSKKIAGTTYYTYNIYKRSSYYTCAVGTLSGSTCYIYTNPTTSTSTTSKCPNGYTQSGNTCYIKKDLTTSTSSSCPNGYTQSGNTCYIKKDMTTTSSSSCPSGYTQSGNTCYIKTTTTTTTSATCPDGYTNNGTNCYKKTNASSSTTATTYSCPAGYSKEGIGANTKCYKEYQTNDTYYCENEGATLKGTKCYLTVDPQFNGYSCPSGYNLDNSTCVKTTAETVNPIWTIADRTYSSASSLSGYQKTGYANFVTKCSPIPTEEIHYK